MFFLGDCVRGSGLLACQPALFQDQSASFSGLSSSWHPGLSPCLCCCSKFPRCRVGCGLALRWSRSTRCPFLMKIRDSFISIYSSWIGVFERCPSVPQRHYWNVPYTIRLPDTICTPIPRGRCIRILSIQLLSLSSALLWKSSHLPVPHYVEPFSVAFGRYCKCSSAALSIRSPSSCPSCRCSADAWLLLGREPEV